MSQLDDLFRDGLGARKADVPNTNDLWARINAGKNAAIPAGEALDKTFRDGLAGRQAAVPAGMWARIAAARGRKPLVRWFAAAAALLLLLTAGGLGYKMLQTNPGDLPTKVAPDVMVAQAEQAPKEIIRIDQLAAANNAEESSVASVDKAIDLSDGQIAAFTESSEVRIPTVPLNTQEGLSTTDETNSPTLPSRRTSAAVSSLEGMDFALSTQERSLPEVNVVPGKFKSTSALRGLQTELLFGVSYARQELSQQTADSDLLRESRELSEYPEFGYQITLRSTYRFNDRLRVLAGLTYAEIRNELQYQLLVNGQTTSVRSNNSIRMLEAPILLGYSIPGRRVNLTVNAGPVVNLTTGVRGRFLDPAFPQLQDLRTEGNFRRNTGIGFMASITTAYQIGKERPFTLLVEPFFKAYPTAFTVKDAPLREKYWVAGLQLGLRKSL